MIILKRLPHEMKNVKRGEFDHRRERQICSKMGEERGEERGGGVMQNCGAGTGFDQSWQKTFPLDEVFASLGDCFGSVT